MRTNKNLMPSLGQELVYGFISHIFSRTGTELESSRLFLLVEPHRNILVPTMVTLAAHYTVGEITGGQDSGEGGHELRFHSRMGCRK